MGKKPRIKFLQRPIRGVVVRFNSSELRDFLRRVKNTGLSRAEYGRRKVLDIPLVDIDESAARQETHREAAAKI
jgi:hypothetical protein